MFFRTKLDILQSRLGFFLWWWIEVSTKHAYIHSTRFIFELSTFISETYLFWLFFGFKFCNLMQIIFSHFKGSLNSNSAGGLLSHLNDEHGDHDEEEDIPTLQRTLEMLSLSEYISTFEQEKIDMESLV